MIPQITFVGGRDALRLLRLLLLQQLLLRRQHVDHLGPLLHRLLLQQGRSGVRGRRGRLLQVQHAPRCSSGGCRRSKVLLAAAVLAAAATLQQGLVQLLLHVAVVVAAGLQVVGLVEGGGRRVVSAIFRRRIRAGG